MKRLLLASATIGLVTLALKRASRKREEWRGLSETDVREKLDHRLPNRIPDERRSAVTEKIVEKMRARGAIVDPIDLDDVDGARAEDAAGDVEIDLDEQSAEVDEDITTPTT